MYDTPNFHEATLAFGQLEDKLLLAQEAISRAMQSGEKLDHHERRRLVNMNTKIRLMMGQYRSAR